MKKSVLVLSDLPEIAIESLKKNFEVEMVLINEKDFLERYEARLPTAHGLIGFGFPLSSAQLERAQKLEAVATVSVGYDPFDLAAFSARQIRLTNTPDVLTETTADLGFALLMSAARRIGELTDTIRRGKWSHDSTDTFGVDIYGKKLGIIGFGRIGQAIARRGHFGFGMPILYYNRTAKKEGDLFKARQVSLTELLQESDFVCTVIPLTPDTENLLGASEFALMKKEAIFVNIARGKVIDETALIHALKSGALRGAALDVFREEPLPASSPLCDIPQLVLTPHVGSATQETRTAMAMLAVENLTLALQGKKPPCQVNE